MKTLLYTAVAALILSTGAAAAQTATSNSNSSSSSSANSQSGAVAIAGGGGGGRANNSVTTRYQNQRQAPGFGVAGLGVGGLSCRGSAGASVSFPGGGFGFGTSTPDDECERRQWAGMLANARDRRARELAWYVMARSGIIQQALNDAGYTAGPSVQGAGYAVRPAPGAGGSGRAAVGGCTKWRGDVVGSLCLY
jgi:hypothetical protein